MRWFTLLLVVLAVSLAAPELVAAGRPRWERQEITLVATPSLRAIVPDATEVLERVARRWSSVPGAPFINVEEGPDGPAANDGKNRVSFVPEGEPLAAGALGITIATYDDSGRLLDADIRINGVFRFGKADEDGRLFDLEALLAHELGHVLGLPENTEHPHATMFPRASVGEIERRYLSAADQQALSNLYAEPLEDATGCGGASVAGRDGGVGWLAVAALAWLVSYRRRRSGPTPARHGRLTPWLGAANHSDSRRPWRATGAR